MTDALNTALAAVKENCRMAYRSAEMSAQIMRDARRTGGWEGSERTARAFDRIAKDAKAAHDGIAALSPAEAPPAQTSEQAGEAVRKALEFYAHHAFIHPIDERGRLQAHFVPSVGLTNDQGERARQALAALSRGRATEDQKRRAAPLSTISEGRRPSREQLTDIIEPVAFSLPGFERGNINNAVDAILALKDTNHGR